MDNNTNEVKATDPIDHTVAVMKTMTESHFKYELLLQELRNERNMWMFIAFVTFFLLVVFGLSGSFIVKLLRC